ncbi:hypothetical protein EVAR_80841_1 [Eumeta japonica]|uniref:Uncharacterized protein n=1 Tax=Eumeta variegata TaxID=151549 RepID=A0A4C1V029_EUMVA|nr:hypothetical protein EVAR_80841_1 [Eumeta japonica]
MLSVDYAMNSSDSIKLAFDDLGCGKELECTAGLSPSSGCSLNTGGLSRQQYGPAHPAGGGADSTRPRNNSPRSGVDNSRRASSKFRDPRDINYKRYRDQGQARQLHSLDPQGLVLPLGLSSTISNSLIVTESGCGEGITFSKGGELGTPVYTVVAVRNIAG